MLPHHASRDGVQTPAEVDAKAARAESIRAVRIILDRSKPPEIDLSANPHATPSRFRAVR